MWNRRSTTTEDELFDALVTISEPAVTAAEEAVPVLDYALGQLPDLDEEGEVRRFRDVLASSSKELKRQLTVALGPSTIKGVRKNVELIWDAIAKTEEIRLLGKLQKDAHAIAVSGAVANFRATGEGFRQIHIAYKELLAMEGLQGVDHLGDENWAQALSRLVMVSTAPLYAAAAGTAEHGSMVAAGRKLFSNPDSMPSSLDVDELEGPSTLEQIKSRDHDDE